MDGYYDCSLVPRDERFGDAEKCAWAVNDGDVRDPLSVPGGPSAVDGGQFDALRTGSMLALINADQQSQMCVAFRALPEEKRVDIAGSESASVCTDGACFEVEGTGRWKTVRVCDQATNVCESKLISVGEWEKCIQ